MCKTSRLDFVKAVARWCLPRSFTNMVSWSNPVSATAIPMELGTMRLPSLLRAKRNRWGECLVVLQSSRYIEAVLSESLTAS